MEAIERLETNMNARFNHIDSELRMVARQRGEYLVLRSRMKRCEDDVTDVTKLATSHERKINYALGASAVVGAVAAWCGWAAKQLWQATLGKSHGG